MNIAFRNPELYWTYTLYSICERYTSSRNRPAATIFLLKCSSVIWRRAYILVSSAIICLAECCYCLGQEQTCSHYILFKVLFFLQTLWSGAEPTSWCAAPLSVWQSAAIAWARNRPAATIFLSKCSFAEAVIRCGAYTLACRHILSLAECCCCLCQEQTCSHYILVKELFFLQMLWSGAEPTSWCAAQLSVWQSAATAWDRNRPAATIFLSKCSSFCRFCDPVQSLHPGVQRHYQPGKVLLLLGPGTDRQPLYSCQCALLQRLWSGAEPTPWHADTFSIWQSATAACARNRPAATIFLLKCSSFCRHCDLVRSLHPGVRRLYPGMQTHSQSGRVLLLPMPWTDLQPLYLLKCSSFCRRCDLVRSLHPGVQRNYLSDRVLLLLGTGTDLQPRYSCQSALLFADAVIRCGACTSWCAGPFSVWQGAATAWARNRLAATILLTKVLFFLQMLWSSAEPTSWCAAPLSVWQGAATAWARNKSAATILLTKCSLFFFQILGSGKEPASWCAAPLSVWQGAATAWARNRPAATILLTKMLFFLQMLWFVAEPTSWCAAQVSVWQSAATAWERNRPAATIFLSKCSSFCRCCDPVRSLHPGVQCHYLSGRVLLLLGPGTDLQPLLFCQAYWSMTYDVWRMTVLFLG